MSPRSSRRLALGAIVVLPMILLLTACVPNSPGTEPVDDTADTPPTTVETDPDSSGIDSSGLDEDILMIVVARATADNGAALDMRLSVHRSTAWDDPVGASRAALMTSVCDGSLDASVYEAQLWSFAQIDYIAVADPATPAWPANRPLRLMPYSSYLSVAADGVIVDDDNVDDATPYCKRDKLLTGAGEGIIVAGFQGDTDAAGAAGGFTKWANHLYGFVGHEVAGQSAADAGITISACSYLVTEAGAALNGDASWWIGKADESNCYIGSSTEDHDS